jgi:hypothetical protein
MLSRFRNVAWGLQLTGSVALAACSPGGHSSSQSSVRTTTGALGTSPAIWRQEGPAPITNCDASTLPFSDCTGAAQQPVVDPTTGAVYLATVNGGIFKTTDSFANTIFNNPPSPIHWTPLIDSGPSLSMSALAMDPADPSTLIAGTGTYSSEGATGSQGVVYILKNGGANVTTVDDPNLRGHKITALTIRGSLALATTSDYGPYGTPAGGGAFRSGDGGHSWQSLLGTGGLPSDIGDGWDLVADPSNADRYYLVAGTGANTGEFVSHQGGIYLGTNSGQTWTMISGLDASSGIQFKLDNAQSARLAVSPAGRLYLEIIQYNQPLYVGFTDNRGQNFTAMDLPRFDPGCDANTSNPVAITNVTALADGRALVTTAGPHCLASPGSSRVHISGVQGIPALTGDYVPIAVVDNNGVPSSTELTLGDPLLTVSNADQSPRPILVVDLVGGVQPPPGTVIGTGGALEQWQGPNFGQGDKQAIAADPTNPKYVYVSGDAPDQRVVRGDTTQTVTGGLDSLQWASISGAGATNGTHPHADTRHLAFDTSGNLLVTCDGGFYLRKNPQVVDAWYTLNGDAQTGEMHDVAFDLVSHGLLGGLQDNGTPSVSQSIGAPIPWAEIEGSDGGDVKSVAVLSTTDPRCQPVGGQPICSYRYSSTVPADCGPNCFWDFERHLFDTSGTELDQNNGTGPLYVIPPLIDSATQAPLPSEDGLFFVTPFEVNKQNSNRLVISGQNGVWESFDLGQTVTLIAGSPAGSGVRPADQNGTGPSGTLAYGHPSNPDVLWVASTNGVFVRFTAGAAMTQVATFPTTNDDPNIALSIVMSQANPQVAFATSQHNVFETTNGGTSWSNLTGDLATFARAPNQGPGLLRKIVYVPSATSGDRIFVSAADLGQPGVYMMAVANPGVWTQVGANLPNALAYDLDYDASRDQLVAGLVGRGAWTIPNVTQLDRAPVSSCTNATLPADATCHATATPATFNASATDPEGNPIVVTLSPSGPFAAGTTPVTLTSTDNQGAGSGCNAQLTVVDVTAPIITAPPPVTVTSCIGVQAITVGTATATDNCTTPVVTGQVISQNGVTLNPPIPVVSGQVNLGPGTYVIRWSATDGVNTATATQTVTVAGGVETSLSFLLDDRSTLETPGGGFAAVLNAGSGQTKVGQDVRSGSVFSIGAVAVQHRAIVNGNVVSAGTISKDSDATITGTSTQFASVLLPALPTLPAFPNPTLGTFTVNSGSQSHGPGSYTSGTVNGGTLILSAGDYFFQSLTINANVTVRVQPTTRIFVKNTLAFQSPLLAASGSTVQAITLGFAGTTLTMPVTFNGTLIAPSAAVTLGSNSVTFTGSFFARTLEVEPGNNVICSP